MSFETWKESGISDGEFSVPLCLGHRVLSHWVKHSSGVFMWVFLGEINCWICRPNKADDPPQWVWASPNQLKTWTEQTGWTRGGSLWSSWLLWTGTPVFSNLWTQNKAWAFLDSQACESSNWNSCHWLSWFSGLQTQTRATRWAPVLLISDLGVAPPR